MPYYGHPSSVRIHTNYHRNDHSLQERLLEHRQTLAERRNDEIATRMERQQRDHEYLTDARAEAANQHHAAIEGRGGTTAHADRIALREQKHEDMEQRREKAASHDTEEAHRHRQITEQRMRDQENLNTHTKVAQDNLHASLEARHQSRKKDASFHETTAANKSEAREKIDAEVKRRWPFAALLEKKKEEDENKDNSGEVVNPPEATSTQG